MNNVSLIFEPKALLQFLFDTALVIWFLKPVWDGLQDRRRLILGAVILLFNAPLYFLTNIAYISRVIIRFAVCLAAMNAAGVKNFLRTVYFSGLITLLLTACQNVFFSPRLFGIYRGTFVFTGFKAADLVICLAIQWLAYLIVFIYIRSTLKLDKLTHFEPFEWIVLLLALAVEFYIKQALPSVTDTEGEHIEITVFSIILSIVLVAFLGSFVRYLHEKRRSEEMRLQEVLNQAYFKNLELKKQRDEDIRRLHHDMKNHLLAMENMAGTDKNRLTEYLGQLSARLEPYETLVETGNELLNGILSEKLALARSKDIDLEIQADCSGLGFVSDTDLCTIFGNALDNAIEACENVEPKEDRAIRVKSEMLAGQFFITVTNSYAGTVEMNGGLPQTTKKDKAMHGIGIRSVKRALEKYSGTLSLHPGDGKFTFTVVIPCR